MPQFNSDLADTSGHAAIVGQELVGEPGVEPGPLVPETSVRPIHHSPKLSQPAGDVPNEVCYDNNCCAVHIWSGWLESHQRTLAPHASALLLGHTPLFFYQLTFRRQLDIETAILPEDSSTCVVPVRILVG